MFFVNGVTNDLVDLKGEPIPDSPCVCTIRNLEDREHEVSLYSTDKYSIDSFMVLQDDLESASEEFPVSMPPDPRTEPIAPPPDLEIHDSGDDKDKGKDKSSNKTGIIVGVVVVVVIVVKKKHGVAQSSDM